MDENSEEYADVLTAVQEGEFDAVQEVIGGRFVSANALDQSGCSLLHWAAINNRIEIARFLIENGLTKSAAGGVLGESPLQWAIRKKYYLMMELIYKQTQCDLSLKAKQGYDALHLACRLGKHIFNIILLRSVFHNFSVRLRLADSIEVSKICLLFRSFELIICKF